MTSYQLVFDHFYEFGMITNIEPLNLSAVKNSNFYYPRWQTTIIFRNITYYLVQQKCKTIKTKLISVSLCKIRCCKISNAEILSTNSK